MRRRDEGKVTRKTLEQEIRASSTNIGSSEPLFQYARKAEDILEDKRYGNSAVCLFSATFEMAVFDKRRGPIFVACLKFVWKFGSQFTTTWLQVMN